MRTTTSSNGFSRIVVISALIALITGLLLWGAAWLAGPRPATAELPVAPVATAVVQASSTAVAAAQLPTIVVAAELPTIAQPTATVKTDASAPSTQTPTLTVAVTQEPADLSDVRDHLTRELGCLAPRARHDPALDALADERAAQPIPSVDADSIVQIAEQDGQRVVLGSTMLAQITSPSPRCGETLLFGIPPLDWLKDGMRFGLGVELQPHAAVIVVVTR